MSLDGLGKRDKGLERIKRVLSETFEPEEDLQVKDVIASQLLAIDEKLFLGYLGSSDSHTRSLVLRYVENEPELLKRSGKISLLKSFYLEEEKIIIGQYCAIFDKINHQFFPESEIEHWKEQIRTVLREKELKKPEKLARISGLLEIAEGLEIFNLLARQEDLPSAVIVDILWMAKRLLTASKTGTMEQMIEFSENLNPEQLIMLADFAEHGTTGISLIFELLAVLGDFDKKRNAVYNLFEEIMHSDDYQLQIILLKALAHSQSYRADIIFCNALSTSSYDSVREVAAEVIINRKEIACLEVVRNSLVYDPDFAVRRRCVQILATKGEEEDVGFLIRAVLDSDKQVVKEALAMLQDKQLDSLAEILMGELLESTDITARQAALLILQQVNLENKTFLLTKALINETTNLKTEIIKTIGRTEKYNQEIASLLEFYLTGDSFFEIRSEAAISLGKISSTDSIPLLLEQYFKEEDFEVKKSIMIALSMLESSEVKQRMLQVLEKPQKHSIKNLLLAVEAAGMLKLVEALEYLQPFFSASDYDIRWQTVVSTGEIMEEVVDSSSVPEGLIDSIIKLVMHDSRPTIRSAACWTLAKADQARMEEVVQVLVDRLKNDDDNMVREMAAEMLGKYQSPLNEAIPVLANMVKNEKDPSIRYYSAYSLGLIARSISGEMMTYQKTLEKPERR